ncbi:GNAT family N-acetyltransferase [Streptomyces sp. NPDC007084]|uniref:GNAT family N-acetyltransferase n=1 Tax=Streptomyces sp. NPDC007084 TaxID=3154313 RepID=UPI0034559011
MTEFTVLDDVTEWQRDFERRRRASYAAGGLGAAAVERRLEDLRAGRSGWTVAEITDLGTRVGHVAVTVVEERGIPGGRIVDLHVEAHHAGHEHERAARDWAEAWCAERGARRIDVDVRLADPAGELFGHYRVRGQLRTRRVGPAGESRAGVTARSMTDTEYPEWLASEKASYAEGMIRTGVLSPEEARAKSDADFAKLVPEGLATPDNTFLVLEAEGETIGTGWLKHGFLPEVTYGYSLNVEERYRGKGYGRAAMAVGEQATLAAGDSVLMFTVWGGNEVAMNLYTSAGYRILQETRSIELPAPESAGTEQGPAPATQAIAER